MCHHQCQPRTTTSAATFMQCGCCPACQAAATVEPMPKFSVFDVPAEQWIGGGIMTAILIIMIVIRA